MSLTLTPRLEAMIQEKVETGRFSDASEVVSEALRLLDSQEHARLDWLREQMQSAKAQWDRGELIEFNNEFLDEIEREIDAEFESIERRGADD